MVFNQEKGIQVSKTDLWLTSHRDHISVGVETAYEDMVSRRDVDEDSALNSMDTY